MARDIFVTADQLQDDSWDKLQADIKGDYYHGVKLEDFFRDISLRAVLLMKKDSERGVK